MLDYKTNTHPLQITSDLQLLIYRRLNMTQSTLNRAIKALINAGHLPPKTEDESLACLQKEFCDTEWKPWHLDDVHDISMSLTDLEAQKVLRQAIQQHDPLIGVTTYVLKDTADKLEAERPEDPYWWNKVSETETLLELCPAIYSSHQPKICAKVIIYQADKALNGFAFFYPDLQHGEVMVDGFQTLCGQITKGKITRSICSSISDLIDRFIGLDGAKIEPRPALEIDNDKEF
jgi:hypothetical protein